MGLPDSEDSLTIGWAVSTQYQRVTERRTDRQTDSLYQERAQYDWRTLMKLKPLMESIVHGASYDIKISVCSSE